LAITLLCRERQGGHPVDLANLSPIDATLDRRNASSPRARREGTDHLPSAHWADRPCPDCRRRRGGDPARAAAPGVDVRRCAHESAQASRPEMRAGRVWPHGRDRARPPGMWTTARMRAAPPLTSTPRED